jgi:aminomethyltransferase
MRKTALTSTHIDLGAKMVEFAGYYMPLQYEGLGIEHETVRNGVGVFDVSHMGEFIISGPNALDLIQKVSSNDATKLTVGKAQYSCLPNDQGGIVDDLIIYKIKEEQYLLVVNASNIEKDWEWITKHNTMAAEMKDLSMDYSLLAIQGPKAIDAMQSLTSVDLAQIPFYNFEVAEFAGIDNVIISATGYTGSGGFEIYCKNNEVQQIWEKVFEAGADFGIKPIGLAARDTLRLEKGYCLYGNDINDTTSPIEAQKEAGVTRKLVGFEMIERGIPRHDYPIVDTNGKEIGIVTSGTMSPSLNKGIGMGYVTKESSSPDSEIFVQIRNKQIKAVVVKTPFLK